MHNSKKIKLIVLGSFGSDLDKISDYYFVECPGQVSHEEAYRYLKSADLFVQNSILESFNLATVEALISGCSILISKNVGAISILKGIQNQDIIFDNDDLEELTEKIKINLISSNNERILNSIDRNSTSYKFASTRLIKIIEEVS
nr:glycosyltransferase [Exiguobacterium sp. U13-1]